MKKQQRIFLPFLVIALSAGINKVSAQTTGQPAEAFINFYDAREYHNNRVEEHEKKKYEGENELQREEREKEDHTRLDYERWSWYWQDRLDVSSGTEARPADVSMYMRSYYYAMNGTQPPVSETARGNGSNPQLLAYSSAICPTGGGAWSCVGPGTATTTHPAPIMGLVSCIYNDPAVADAQHIYVGTRSGGLFETTNGGTSWTNLTDASRMPAMNVSSIAIHPLAPQTIYISSSFDAPGNVFDFAHRGTYGFGVLKSTDGGATWTEVLTLPNYIPGGGVSDCVREVKIHPDDPNTVYALGENKVFMSTNGGASWIIVLDVVPGGGGNACANQPAHIEIIPGVTGVSDSHVMVTTYATGWAMNGNWGCTPSRIFVSNIGGNLIGSSYSFFDISPSVLTGTEYTEEVIISLQPGNPYEFFMCYGDLDAACPLNQRLKMKKYNISSSSVIALPPGPNTPNSGGSLLELQFSINNPNVFFVGGWTLFRYDLTTGGLGGTVTPYSAYWPTNGCNTPDPNFTHADVRSLAVVRKGFEDIILMGDDGGLQRLKIDPSLPPVANPVWTNLNGPGFNTSCFFWLAGSEYKYDELVCGAQDNGVLEYLSGTWSHVADGDGYRGVINHNTSPHSYYGYSGGGAVLNTIGSCYGWSFYPGNAIYHGNWPLVTDPFDDNTVYCVGLNGANFIPYKSTNFAGSWTPLTGFPGDGLFIRCIRVSPADPNVIYATKDGPTWGSGTTNRFFRSTDGGATWTDMQAGSPTNPLNAVHWASITDIACDPLNSNHVFVSINGFWNVPSTLNGVNRVFESTDGGVNWTDLTDNMMAFPVTALVYQSGTNDVLYAGTDVGVFRYNKNNAAGSKWECFMNGLPVAPVTALEINHCKNKIRCSTFGRSAWESDLPPTNYSGGQITVSSSTTWSTNRRLTSDVFITGNSNLTVSATVFMSAGKKIIVDRGSTLTVTGTGKLTNSCGDMWLGVEVWGTPTVSQVTAGAQGKVVLQANAIVENCSEGIVTAKNIGGVPDLTYTGGLIQAIGARFYNNRRDVVFYPYQWSIANNLSYLKNCRFETNALLGNSLVPDAHVRMDGVKNVSLVGNTYINLVSSLYTPTTCGTGIYATNSQCSIDDYNTISQNAFHGLTNGVSANFTSGTVKSFNVYNTDFTFVQRGVEINYSYSSTVSNCLFVSIPLAVNTSFTNATWGVRVNNATVFYVVNNIMTGMIGSNLNNYGIIADNCGSNAGLISGNTMQDLYTGIQVQGLNGSGANGVQMKCNTFYQLLPYQIAVCPSTAGTLADQGSACSLGNTRQNNFYVSATPACNQISVGAGTSFTYYASGTIPTVTCGAVTVVSCSSVSGECSGGGGGGGGSGNRITLIDSLLPEGPSAEEYVTALKLIGTEQSKAELAGVYTSLGRYDEASNMIAQLRDENASEDVVDYCTIMLGLARANGYLYDLQPGQLNRLSEIALGTTTVALSAQVIMSQVNGNTYDRITEHFESREQQDNGPDAVVSHLGNNVPNPFSSATRINCYVSADVQNASLEICSVDGKSMQSIPLTNGENSVSFESKGLSSGVYYYTLRADGKSVETKRMVIIKEE